MVTVDNVRRLALTLPRSEEALVHDQVKFRVRGLVYVAFSRTHELVEEAWRMVVPKFLARQRLGC